MPERDKALEGWDIWKQSGEELRMDSDQTQCKNSTLEGKQNDFCDFFFALLFFKNF